MPDNEPLAAGEFGAWLREFDGVLAGERSADVPCGGCSGCCTSSQFVHVAPDEEQTLAAVPPELLFEAPGLPRGHVVLGYDDRGHCPMLVHGRCSIYDARPRTCRTYDCRVFAAAGIDSDRPAIDARVRSWTFDHLGRADLAQHDASRAAGRYLRAHRDDLPEGAVPANPTQLAVLAVRVRHLFLSGPATDESCVLVEPDLERVRSVLAELREPISPA
jgi:hypothetical protein